jgi:hypothetical protein
MSCFTKLNHYNPCFWTAFWNPSYYEHILANRPNPPAARKQEIYTLNIRADKILHTIFEKVHYQKDLGVAKISPESMITYCSKNRPEELDSCRKYFDGHPETVFIDFEEILTGLEKVGGYESLREAVINEGLTSVGHKGYISILLIYHAMRSYEMMTFMVENAAKKGIDKWEYFVNLKKAWGDPQLLARAVTPMAQGRWTFYKTTQHRFPICDSPVLVNENSVMAILSPRLLLEIDLNVHRDEGYWEYKDGISFSKYREFRRRAINNAFNDILFHDAAELEEWQKLPECRKRCGIVRDIDLRKSELQEAAERVVFALSGFGRVPKGIVFPV